MGYHVPFIAPPGRDGGVDAIAYKDPLGTVAPRIKVQVKHKEQKATVREVRELGAPAQRRRHRPHRLLRRLHLRGRTRNPLIGQTHRNHGPRPPHPTLAATLRSNPGTGQSAAATGQALLPHATGRVAFAQLTCILNQRTANDHQHRQPECRH